MDSVFKNEFEMTWERYKYLSFHPYGRRAKNQLRARNVISLILLIIILVRLIVYSIDTYLAHSTLNIGIFIESAILLALLGMVYFLFHIKVKRQYKITQSIQPTSKWIRTTSFADNVKVQDANAEYTYEYSYFRSITEDDEYFCLWHDENFVFRIPKDTFTIGDPNEFAEFVTRKISDNNTRSITS